METLRSILEGFYSNVSRVGSYGKIITRAEEDVKYEKYNPVLERYITYKIEDKVLKIYLSRRGNKDNTDIEYEISIPLLQNILIDKYIEYIDKFPSYLVDEMKVDFTNTFTGFSINLRFRGSEVRREKNDFINSNYRIIMNFTGVNYRPKIKNVEYREYIDETGRLLTLSNYSSDINIECHIKTMK